MASKSLNEFAGFGAPGPGESAARVPRVSLAEASYSTLAALMRAPAGRGGGSIASTADGGPGSRGPGGDGPGAPGSSFAGAAGAAPRVDGDVVAALELSDAYETFAETLDEVAAERGIKIGFMKVDVQGAEYNVLRGAIHILRRDKPVVYFEYYLAPGHRLHAPDFPRVLALMERLGYECMPCAADPNMAACVALNK